MAILAAADLAIQLDHLNLGYAKLVGTSGSGYGLGEPGGSYGTADAALDAVTAIAALSDIDQQADLLAAFRAWKDGLGSLDFYGSKLKPIVNRLAYHALQRGAYASLDAWLTYLNVTHATKWQCLAPTQWRDLYYKATGSYPAVNNVYFEVLQGSTYLNALRKSVVTGAGADTETAGQTIDSTNFCGGFAKIVVSGLTGSGVVTVTGTAYNPATQTTSAGVTWTYTVTTNGTFTLAVGTAPADSLIIACSSVTIPAGITAGTIYVEAHRPSGRTLIA
ncbi:MAG: hypothetical protein ACOYOL_07175 [Chthoniobacterales bacterium]